MTFSSCAPTLRQPGSQAAGARIRCRLTAALEQVRPRTAAHHRAQRRLGQLGTTAQGGRASGLPLTGGRRRDGRHRTRHDEGILYKVVGRQACGHNGLRWCSSDALKFRNETFFVIRLLFGFVRLLGITCRAHECRKAPGYWWTVLRTAERTADRERN